MFLGSPTGPSASYDWNTFGNNNASYLGYALGTVGDVNGDGLSDVMVGSPGDAGGGFSRGSVFLPSAPPPRPLRRPS